MNEKTLDTVSAAPPEYVRFEKRGALADIALDRPRALNALNAQMRAAVVKAFEPLDRDPEIYAVCLRSTSDRAFCAGGDVRELVAWARVDQPRARQAFADEYRMNWKLECFAKPAVAFMDGMAMGSGVGLSAYLTHRVAGHGYSFAMPETAIGLFPDVGATHVLARLPHEIGTYLALTGASIGRADAYALGLVSHCIDAERFDEIREALSQAWPIDALLDDRHIDPGPAPLLARAKVIEKCFSAETVEQILLRLAKVDGADKEWAQHCIGDLQRMSPTSLKITLRHIRAAREADLDEVLERDYVLACACLDRHDFREGVRAALIDKDGKPSWQPATLEEVTDAIVEAHFKSDVVMELDLPARRYAQAPLQRS